MIAWMHTWGRNIVPHELGHGWAGNMTLPRILHSNGNQLTQEVPEAVLASLPKAQVGERVDGPAYLDVKIDQDIAFRFGDESDYIEFGYQDGLVYIDHPATKKSRFLVRKSGQQADAVWQQMLSTCKSFLTETRSKFLSMTARKSLTAIYLQGEKIFSK